MQIVCVWEGGGKGEVSGVSYVVTVSMNSALPGGRERFRCMIDVGH